MLYFNIIIYNKHIRHTEHSYYNIISNIKLLSIYGISNRIYELFFTNVTYTQTRKYIYIKNIEVNR
jgi:hypothetical protein